MEIIKKIKVYNEVVSTCTIEKANEYVVMDKTSVNTTLAPAIVQLSLWGSIETRSYITIKDGNGNSISDVSKIHFCLLSDNYGGGSNSPIEVTNGSKDGEYNSYSIEESIDNLFRINIPNATADTLDGELYFVNDHDDSYMEWISEDSAITYPLTITFYKAVRQELKQETYKRLKGQGVIINGDKASRVIDLVYDGLGGNLNASKSPISASSYSRLMQNAYDVTGKNRAVYISTSSLGSILDYASLDDEPISNGLDKGFSMIWVDSYNYNSNLSNGMNYLYYKYTQNEFGEFTFYFTSDKSSIFKKSIDKNSEVPVEIAKDGNNYWVAIDKYYHYGYYIGRTSKYESASTSLNSVFKDCEKLESIDCSSFDLSNVTDTSHLFENCFDLKDIGDISNWDTSKVTDMSYMFYYCEYVDPGDLSKWDISSVTNMSYMFYTSLYMPLVSMKITSWNMSSVTDISYMFAHSSTDTRGTLLDMDFSTWGATTKNITNMSHLFDNSYFNSIGNIWKWDVSNVQDFSYMFANTLDHFSFTSQDWASWDVGSAINMSHMFENSALVSQMDVCGWDVSNVTDMSGMFKNCSKLTQIGLGGHYGLDKWDVSKVTNFSEMFRGCKLMTTVNPMGGGLGDWNTSSATDMSHMFHSCSKISYLGNIGSSWDTSKVTDMSYMFYGCSSLPGLSGISNWDVSNVTNMSNMFNGCILFGDFDYSFNKWNVSKVTDMSYMFSNCTKISSSAHINIASQYGGGYWDTSNVTNMDGMFNGCSSWKAADLYYLDMTKVSTAKEMFKNDTSLVTLNMTSTNMSNVTDATNMFYGCSVLTTFYISKLPKSSSVTIDFSDCPLNDTSMQYMVNNTAGGCILKFSDTTKALDSYSTYKTSLTSKGFTIQ